MELCARTSVFGMESCAEKCYIFTGNRIKFKVFDITDFEIFYKKSLHLVKFY